MRQTSTECILVESAGLIEGGADLMQASRRSYSRVIHFLIQNLLPTGSLLSPEQSESAPMRKTQKHNFAWQGFAMGAFPIAAIWETGLNRRHGNQTKITLADFQYDKNVFITKTRNLEITNFSALLFVFSPALLDLFFCLTGVPSPAPLNLSSQFNWGAFVINLSI
jgi:hypothetical protein